MEFKFFVEWYSGKWDTCIIHVFVVDANPAQSFYQNPRE
jgi:hypothetical protein